jgi:hypothetical protein
MKCDTTDPKLTLGEAIRQIRLQNGEPDMTRQLSGSARAFDMHDAVHVLFGCDETLKGEISAHVWMAFATTAPLTEMHRAVASGQHRSVLSGVGRLKVLGTWLRMLPKIAIIVRRSRQMAARVPYDELPSLMRLPVEIVRMRYGIAVPA